MPIDETSSTPSLEPNPVSESAPSETPQAFAQAHEEPGFANAQPPVIAEPVFRWFDNWLQRLDRLVDTFLPPRLNPILQSGGVANVSLIICIITGALLLFWYSASVNTAYSSTEAMSDSFIAQLMRSLHRYSSDACMLFVLLHSIQSIAGRRFAGPRWVAWITGILLLGFLWFVGWLGYWLVWDLRGQLVATGSAKIADVVPIFVDPLSRSFLTDSSVTPLLFFMVFFAHMLVPLAMGIALWLHIVRVSRANFLTNWPTAAAVTGTLIALSIAIPATSEAPAKMTVVPESITMDWWYLLPLNFTDRLGGGALWLLLMVAGIISLSVPWWVVRRGRARKRKPVATRVDISRCNACEKCFNDCPYDAITMVKRTDGKHFPAQAEVNPSRCVGCAVCSGSCDSAGIDLPWMQAIPQRARIDTWLHDAKDSNEPAPFIAFLCAESLAANIEIDAKTGICAALPGYRVITVPCTAWVHMLTVERALRRGAGGVLIAGCRDGSCSYREGAKWTEQRISGERAPVLRTEKIESSDAVRYIQLDRPQSRQLAKLAADFRAQKPLRFHQRKSRGGATAFAIGLATVFAALTYLPSELPYQVPTDSSPKLVVSFKHPGVVSERCWELSDEELASRPVHMRQKTQCERGRSSVRLRVTVDGQQLLSKAYRPHGIKKDGNSVGIAEFSLSEGKHLVVVEIGDAWNQDEWAFRDEQTVEFVRFEKRVVLFDKLSHFTWH